MSETELIVTEGEVEHMPATRAPTRDMGSAILSLSVPEQDAYLAEYWDRRTNFRDWLKSKLVEGIHFGYPPGCEPRQGIKPEQWTAKPSLYKAGAELICNLLDLRVEYEADLVGWQQMGSRPGTFVYACRLYPHGGTELIGEGRGLCWVEYKKMGANAVIKMAMKSALVCAVLSAYGLSDLFTQDLEDIAPEPPPEHANPAADPGAPKVPPRGQRKAASGGIARKANILYANFTQVRKGESGGRLTGQEILVAWVAFVAQHTGRDDITGPNDWTDADVAKVAAALGLKVEDLA